MDSRKNLRNNSKALGLLILFCVSINSCEQSAISRRTVKKLSEKLEGEAYELSAEDETKGMRLSAKSEAKLPLLAIDELPPDSIYFYSAGRVSGNMGGRMGANQLCVKRFRSLPPGFLSVAFLSVHGKDRLDQLPMTASVPIDLPIKSLKNRELIAKRWNDLFSNQERQETPILVHSLLAAAVYKDGGNRIERYEGLFWSGGLPAQAEEKNHHHCERWTSDDTWGYVGGNHGSSHPDYQKQKGLAWRFPWYDYQMILPCQTPQTLLCILYPNKAHH